MNSSQFKVNELKKLSTILGFKPDVIKDLVENIDEYYREWIEKKIDKKTGDFKRYKDGTIKERVIRPSFNDLKKIQSRIKDKILVSIELPNCVHGGVRGRSNITNAKPHQGNKFQFTTDLQNFYPSISSKRIYNTFLNLGYSSHMASWITKLTSWKHELPQGTPTSTHIANLVFLKIDLQIIDFCKEHGLTYTRYIDDLTFSSSQDFKPCLNDLLKIITQNGFNISYRKTKYMGNQNITGIDVYLHKIDAPLKIKEKAIVELELNSKSKPYNNYLNNILKTNKKSF